MFKRMAVPTYLVLLGITFAFLVIGSQESKVLSDLSLILFLLVIITTLDLLNGLLFARDLEFSFWLKMRLVVYGIAGSVVGAIEGDLSLALALFGSAGAASLLAQGIREQLPSIFRQTIT